MKKLLLLLLIGFNLVSCLEIDEDETGEALVELEETVEDELDPFGIGIEYTVNDQCIEYFTFEDLNHDKQYQDGEVILSSEATVCLTDLVSSTELEGLETVALVLTAVEVRETSDTCDSTSFTITLGLDTNDDTIMQDEEVIATYTHCNEVNNTTTNGN